jgi:hypothetical protein
MRSDVSPPRTGLGPVRTTLLICGATLTGGAVILVVALWLLSSPAWVSEFAERAQGTRPEPAARRIRSAPPFRLVDYQVTPGYTRGKAKLAGEVRNEGQEPMGVQLQAVIRDRSGRVVNTVEFWPASVANIEPGATFAFSYTLDCQPTDRVDVRIIDAKSR